jgi:hypothetical protein
MAAYRPALLFTDSFAYLRDAHDLTPATLRPMGYSVLLRAFEPLSASHFWVVVLQHVLGVGLAVLCYCFLVRRGVPGWGAALAVLPVLIDPLQLVLEHYILADVLFEALLVVACILLLWHHRPGPATVALVGTLVASAALVRGAGTFLLAFFLIALLCLRVRWTTVAAYLAAVAVPLSLYAVYFHDHHGKYAVTTGGPRFLYARLAPIMPCSAAELPVEQRPLCPQERVGDRPDTNYYMWTGRKEWMSQLRPPEGMTQDDVLRAFDKRMVRSQPVVYARAVLRDFARGFGPSRTKDVPGYPAEYWLFDDHYWSMDSFIASGEAPASRLRGKSYNPTAASALKTYRHWVYTPGPLLALLVLLCAAAVVGLGRSRFSAQRVAVGVLSGSVLLTMATGAALSGFSWRYQLPQIPLLPVAGALALTALIRGPAPSAPTPPAALRLLERVAPGRGWLQLLVALLVGALSGGAIGSAAVASGWAAPRTALVLGAAVLVGVTVVLLGARLRERPAPG